MQDLLTFQCDKCALLLNVIEAEGGEPVGGTGVSLAFYKETQLLSLCVRVDDGQLSTDLLTRLRSIGEAAHVSSVHVLRTLPCANLRASCKIKRLDCFQ